MYPGYSPADHEYGKAAEEYGRAATAARAQGIEIKPKDFDYNIGQARGNKRKALESIEAAKPARESGSGPGSGSRSDRPATKDEDPHPTNDQIQQDAQDKPSEERDESQKPAFFIDVNPTPVDFPTMKTESPKRNASSQDPVEEKKHKKTKKEHVGDLPGTADSNGVEFEDISQEVDARLKEKEEKRKHQGEKKKRKRDSGETPAAEVEAAAEPGKPKKKKSKKAGNPDEPNVTDVSPKKRPGADDSQEQGEGKKKKRKKNKEKEH